MRRSEKAKGKKKMIDQKKLVKNFVEAILKSGSEDGPTDVAMNAQRALSGMLGSEEREGYVLSLDYLTGYAEGVRLGLEFVRGGVHLMRM